MQEKIIDSLKNINNSLEQRIDSLSIQNQIEKITYKIENQNSIASEINQFYDSAWLKLLFVITILGIVVPIIVQYFQSKNLKDLTKELKEKFDSKLDLLKEDYENKIDSLIQNHKTKFKQLEIKNEKALIELEANTFHLHGRALFNEKDYLASFGSFLIAGKESKNCGRMDRIGINLDSALANLKKFKKEDFIKLNDFLIENFECKSLEESLSELENGLSSESVLILKISEIRNLVKENKSA